MSDAEIKKYYAATAPEQKRMRESTLRGTSLAGLSGQGGSAGGSQVVTQAAAPQYQVPLAQQVNPPVAGGEVNPGRTAYTYGGDVYRTDLSGIGGEDLIGQNALTRSSVQALNDYDDIKRRINAIAKGRKR